MKAPVGHYREDAVDEARERRARAEPLIIPTEGCPCCYYPESWSKPGAKHRGPTVAEALAAHDRREAEERERRRASPGPVPGSGSPTTATLDPPPAVTAYDAFE